MMRLIFVLALVFATSFNLLFANNNPTNDDTPDKVDNCFFLDVENKICFIDFEEINGYAKEVYVKNEKGEVIFQQQLWDLFNLPANIYELDYTTVNSSSNLTVELHTFTKVLTKKID